ncbi:MAG TPA: ATP-binding protein, partial [Bacillota bacterium]|nr:ATP-binding protein [Bacillota bacterium]
IPLEQGIIINLHTDLDGRVPAILGTESEIRQALVNLILNAIDAMPEGGVLTLRTRQAPPAEGQVAGAVQVEVADTGVGMDEEIRRRCLEPFFSTKGLRGTGLGLAMVFGAMERHGGSIAVESAPGQGTTMRLVFPVHIPDPAEPPAVAGVTLDVPSLRILCIDDEPLVLDILKRLLQELGHQVETATGGEDGLNLFRAGATQGKPFDVVITDLGMPRMDGRTLARTLKAESPNTPIILLTGWGMFLKAEDRALARVDLILAKPPSLKDLQQSLANVMSVPRAV